MVHLSAIVSVVSLLNMLSEQKLTAYPHPTGLGHATHALKNNAPVKVTTKTLAHASASTLLDNYIHAGEEESSSFFANAN